jgi:hypothetical protein
MKTSAFFRGSTTLALAAILAVGSGCVVSVGDDYVHDGHGFAKVSSSRMDAMVDANRELRLGMRTGEALSLFPEEHLTLKSSAYVGDRVVEEWRVLAVDSRRDILFRRWLYFVDGELVEFSDDRRGLWGMAELPAGWG